MVNEVKDGIIDEIKDIVLKNITDAEMVLVGIGEEFCEKTEKFEESREYAAFMKIAGGAERFQWMIPFVEEIYVKSQKDDRVMAAYKVLETLLQGKNYFIVSTRTDDFIYDTLLRKDRIVTPCGGYRFWQCEQGCGQRVYKRDEQPVREIMNLLNAGGSMEAIKEPLCPVCGKGMVHNNIRVQNYVEEGYLEAWGNYKKWLQGTVNKKLCVLELGVGMKYPSVIRWPFEKMVFFNQKSILFRIHSKLYQLTEEIKDRGYKIEEKPIDFLINRFV